MSDQTVKLKIQAQGGDAAAGEIRKVLTATEQASGGSKKATASFQGQTQAQRELTTATGQLSSGTGALTGALRAMLPALSVAALVGFSRAMATAKDDMAAMRQQALMMSGSSQGFDALYASAQRLGVGLKDASEGVNFFAPALGKLGKTYEQSIDFSEKLTKSMRVYGLQGQAATSITTQLGQALSSGTLSGDELKSLRENAGGLAMELETAIQKALGTTEGLKELGSQGRLSSQVVADAWETVFRNLEGEMAALPDTLAQQEARMSNAATRLMEALDGALHSSALWKWFTSEWTTAMESMADAMSGKISGGLISAEAFGGQAAALQKVTTEITLIEDAIKKVREGWLSVFTTEGEKATQIQGLQAELDKLIAKRDQLIMLGQQERGIAEASLASQTQAAAQAGAAADAWAASAIKQHQLLSAFGATATTTIEQMLPTITAMSAKYNISEAAIIAMMKAESDFNQQALSGKGAVGVMQMTGAAAEQVAAKTGLSLAQMRDGWKENIEGGTAYMRWLLDNSKGAIKSMDDLARAYNAGLGGMNKGYAETEKHGELVSAAFDKITTSGLSMEDQLKKNAEAQKRQATEMDKAATAAEKAAIAQAKVNLAAEEGATTIGQYLAHQEEQLRVAGLTTEEKIRSAEASKIEALALREESAAATAAASGNQALATAHRTSADAIRAGSQVAQDNAVAIAAMQAAHQQAAPTIAELWTTTVTEMSKSIQGGLTTAFEDLFSGTLDSAGKFIDSLKSVVIRGLANLASAILMNPINVVINATLVGASGTAAAGTQGSTTVASPYGGGSSSSSLLSSATSLTGGNSIGTAVAGYFGDSVSKLGLASEGLLNAGTNLAATSNLWLGAGGIAGAVTGNLIFQGKGESEIGSSIGSTAGAVIGSMILPGIGTVVGGILGGAGGGFIGSLFGGDKPKEEILTLKQSGGMISTVAFQGTSEETLKQVQDAQVAINDTLAALSQVLGQGAADALASSQTRAQPLYTKDIGTYLEAVTTNTIEAMLSATTGTMHDLIMQAWEDSGHNVDQILSIAAGLQDLVANLPSITQALADAGVNLGDDAEKATLQLIMMAGGMDNLIASQAAYAQLFVSEEEARANATAALTEQMTSMIGSLPATRAELRAYVDALDMTVTDQVAARLAILSMSDALNTYYTGVEEAAAATGDLSVQVEALTATVVDSTAALAEAQAAYAGLFIGPDEALANTITAINSAFVDMGLVLPATRAELRAMVDSFDLATEAGRLNYIGVLTLADELDAMYTAAESASSAATEAAQEQASAQKAATEAAQEAAAAQRAAIDDAHSARLKALQGETTAAQEALSKIQSVVNALKSAIASFRLDKDVLDQATFKASQAQLVAWASGRGLPEQDALDKALGGLSSFDKASYATQADYARDYWITMSALNTLDQRAGHQLTAAEKMVESLQKQTELENEWYQAEIGQLQTIATAMTATADVVTGVTPPAAAAQPAPSQAPAPADISAALLAEIKEWREAQRLQVVDVALYQKRSADVLRKWDDEGIPDNRDGAVLLRAG